jgi:hypothetical protein
MSSRELLLHVVGAALEQGHVRLGPLWHHPLGQTENIVELH